MSGWRDYFTWGKPSNSLSDATEVPKNTEQISTQSKSSLIQVKFHIFNVDLICTIFQVQNEKFAPYLTWKKIDDHGTIVDESPNIPQSAAVDKKPKKKFQTSIAEGIVPQIPQEMLHSTLDIEVSNMKNSEKLTRKALNNPLVPIGMSATVACLIGLLILNFFL